MGTTASKAEHLKKHREAAARPALWALAAMLGVGAIVLAATMTRPFPAHSSVVHHPPARVAAAASPPKLPAKAPPPAAPPSAEQAFLHDWNVVQQNFPSPADSDFVVVDAARQKLYLFKDGRLVTSWPVSTAVAGLGQENGSLQTPTGLFRIADKVGRGRPPLEILANPTMTGHMARPVTTPGDVHASQYIVGRILKLEGLEPGWNKGGSVDTYRRYIYIHGTPNIGMLGQPASEGCVQMAPSAVVALFRQIPRGTPVLITPGTGNLERIPGL